MLEILIQICSLIIIFIVFYVFFLEYKKKHLQKQGDELPKFVEESIKEGFSKDSIIKVLEEDGHDKKEVEEAFRNVKESNKAEHDFMDEDFRRVLLVVDELLGKLPEEEIARFVETPEFELYKRVLEKAKQKKHGQEKVSAPQKQVKRSSKKPTKKLNKAKAVKKAKNVGKTKMRKPKVKSRK
ncbi:hypothetical protein D6745_03930 [Candidatus Woesearchaeota archaeon]|nr:MAG: hypothetical protein D6745_03930 [Candidatus Woesearchaeota archaeon]